MEISPELLKKLNPKIGLVGRAVRKFGTTNDFREAGFILEGGKMLDFSGKLIGGEPFQRPLDHREIHRAMKLGGWGISGGSAMVFFEREANAIRFSMTGVLHKDPAVNISLITSQKPTEMQIRRMKESVTVCRRIGEGKCAIAGDIYFDDDTRCTSLFKEHALPGDIEMILKDLETCQATED